jgi:hypothetical protein
MDDDKVLLILIVTFVAIVSFFIGTLTPEPIAALLVVPFFFVFFIIGVILGWGNRKIDEWRDRMLLKIRNWM